MNQNNKFADLYCAFQFVCAQTHKMKTKQKQHEKEQHQSDEKGTVTYKEEKKLAKLINKASYKCNKI